MAMMRFDRLLLVICAIVTMFNMCRAIAYSNTKASMKDELPKIVEACFDNTDRYYTQEGYR